MSLVDYSESSSDDQEQHEHVESPAKNNKRKATDSSSETRPQRLPPLPSAFHSLYATAGRISTSDDPSLHAGRTRQTPHVVGNWSTHVYLEWYPSRSEQDRLQQLINQAASVITVKNDSQPALVHTFLTSELGASLPLHVSLSAPLVLRTEKKDAYQESLQAALANADVHPFLTRATGIDWVANKERTRFFLVVRLSKPENDELNRLLEVCNSTAREFGLDELYRAMAHQVPIDKPSKSRPKSHEDHTDAFHISIAWTLRDPTRNEPIPLSQIDIQNLILRFDVVKLKIGSVVTDMNLGEDGGILNK